MRALHLLNLAAGPAALFLPPLRQRGFEIDHVDPNLEPLPESLQGYDAVLVCGGTADTHQTDEHPWLTGEVTLLREALDRGVPTIGLCLGAQLLTEAAGGSVYRVAQPEVGWYDVDVHEAAAGDPVLAELPRRFRAVQWHHYACELPDQAVELARNPACVQAFRVGDTAWGTQFHIEVTREVLLDWQRAAPEELARHGYDNGRYQAELERYLPAHEALGRGMAERFADIAADRAAT